jgi:hypothetical protein
VSERHRLMTLCCDYTGFDFIRLSSTDESMGKPSSPSLLQNMIDAVMDEFYIFPYRVKLMPKSSRLYACLFESEDGCQSIQYWSFLSSFPFRPRVYLKPRKDLETYTHEEFG